MEVWGVPLVDVSLVPQEEALEGDLLLLGQLHEVRAGGPRDGEGARGGAAFQHNVIINV